MSYVGVRRMGTVRLVDDSGEPADTYGDLVEALLPANLTNRSDARKTVKALLYDLMVNYADSAIHATPAVVGTTFDAATGEHVPLELDYDVTAELGGVAARRRLQLWRAIDMDGNVHPDWQGALL